jgi:hypothetical protein
MGETEITKVGRVHSQGVHKILSVDPRENLADQEVSKDVYIFRKELRSGGKVICIKYILIKMYRAGSLSTEFICASRKMVGRFTRLTKNTASRNLKTALNLFRGG